MKTLISELLTAALVLGLLFVACGAKALPMASGSTLTPEQWQTARLSCTNRVAAFRQVQAYYASLLPAQQQAIRQASRPADLARYARLPAQNEEEQQNFAIMQDLMAIDTSYGVCAYN